MLTGFDKAIAGLVGPLVSLLVLKGAIPQDVATPEFIAGMTAVISALAVYFIPNKAAATSTE